MLTFFPILRQTGDFEKIENFVDPTFEDSCIPQDTVKISMKIKRLIKTISGMFYAMIMSNKKHRIDFFQQLFYGAVLKGLKRSHP